MRQNRSPSLDVHMTPPFPSLPSCKLHAQVLDGVAAHVALRHAPEAVAVLGRADDLAQVDVHPRVTAHQMPVVRLPILQLYQLKWTAARSGEEWRGVKR
ncbi:unnamed protein product [Closterium sp. Naga37s-1]|nr:unnamed protein product [Closterium sp. Naga37s-1]